MAKKSQKPKKPANNSIDLHGLKPTEAIEKLELFIDKALLKDFDEIEIIHGIGSGILKNLVHKYLTTLKSVKSFKIKEFNPGTTIAYL